jgi:hypothetical protein
MLGRLSALDEDSMHSELGLRSIGADQSEVDVLSENIAELRPYVPLDRHIHPN